MAAKVMTPTVRAPILLHHGARVVFTLPARVFLLVSFHKKKKKKSLILKSRISFLFSLSEHREKKRRR